MGKKLQFKIRAALMIGCVILVALHSNAQNITGSIVGHVSDSSGAAAPGTVITVLNQGTGASVDATVDDSGSYTVPNLLAGQYQINAKKDGFQTVEVKDIQLLSAQTVRQNFTLQPGGVQQTIEVSSQAPLIHTDSQTIGGSLGSKQVSELPLATRSIDGLLTLAPGVSTAGNNPRISGSNYWGGNNFTLNGISVNDVGNGGAAYTSGIPALGTANLPSPDSMQEFRVDSGNQNAEYRDVATVTMMLKQGDNTFHGLAYEYLQNKVLNANQFLLNATRQPRPDSKFNQFGASLGGPILRNKLFFYGSYRGVRDKYSNTARLTLPSLAMRNGDFSALCTTFSGGVCVKGTQLYNPFNGRAFPN